NARYLSSSNSFRPTPTMDVRGGSNPSRWRLYSAGSSLRCARSPAPPKMTTVTGSAATGGVSATARRSNSDGVAAIVLLHAMAAVDAVWARVQQLEPLGVCLHQPVLDSVVDHLDVVAGAMLPGAQVSAFGRKREKDRFQPFADVDLSADHQAVAFVQTPDAAARAGIDVVNLLHRQGSSPPDVVVEIRVAAVDDGVAAR